MKYIAEAYGLWFEGSSSWLRLMVQPPVLLPIRFVQNAVNMDMLFLEDYFNSATRTRRGQLYQKDGMRSWAASTVSLFPYNNGLHTTNVFHANKSYKTAECSVNHGWTVILGNNNAESHWTVVFSEKVGLDAYYLTLKSKTYFGVLPEINSGVIPEDNRQDILLALDAVVDAAPIQAPQPVIDACRNAACHMISAKFPESNPTGKKDLGPIVRWLNDHGCRTLGDIADVINQLHSRAKANAAAQHGTRPVSQRDTELAVSAVAFMLQDFGWAETTI